MLGAAVGSYAGEALRVPLYKLTCTNIEQTKIGREIFLHKRNSELRGRVALGTPVVMWN